MRTPARTVVTTFTLVRSVARWVGAASVILIVAVFALLLGAGAMLRPAPGDWTTTVRAGPLQLEVGVAALIQWGTTPWISQHLDGRTLPTRVGAMHLAWDEAAQRLILHCQPCTVRSSSWGGEALRLEHAHMTVQRKATELVGTLTSGAVQATWRGNLRPGGIPVHITLPETPLRDAYMLFASAIPEVAVARIEGTVALQAMLALPSKTLTVQPLLQGMVVRGLGTENWAHARSNCARGLPTVHLGMDSTLARAVIAAEDQRFIAHAGYDLAEMTQALHSNQSKDASLRGASTLTQQVAKLLVTGGERSAVRKLRELLYAVEMEHTLGKARIVRLYLDHAPWGATVCGAHAAADTYFGKRADQLTTAQAVWLAAMLHNPALEAHHWRTTGHINQARVQWVAGNLRPMRKAQLARLRAELSTANWGRGPNTTPLPLAAVGLMPAQPAAHPAIGTPVAHAVNTQAGQQDTPGDVQLQGF
jgi:hypothetical protein